MIVKIEEKEVKDFKVDSHRIEEDAKISRGQLYNYRQQAEVLNSFKITDTGRIEYWYYETLDQIETIGELLLKEVCANNLEKVKPFMDNYWENLEIFRQYYDGFGREFLPFCAAIRFEPGIESDSEYLTNEKSEIEVLTEDRLRSIMRTMEFLREDIPNIKKIDLNRLPRKDYMTEKDIKKHEERWASRRKRMPSLQHEEKKYLYVNPSYKEKIPNHAIVNEEDILMMVPINRRPWSLRRSIIRANKKMVGMVISDSFAKVIFEKPFMIGPEFFLLWMENGYHINKQLDLFSFSWFNLPISLHKLGKIWFPKVTVEELEKIKGLYKEHLDRDKKMDELWSKERSLPNELYKIIGEKE